MFLTFIRIAKVIVVVVFIHSIPLLPLPSSMSSQAFKLFFSQFIQSFWRFVWQINLNTATWALVFLLHLKGFCQYPNLICLLTVFEKKSRLVFVFVNGYIQDLQLNWILWFAGTSSVADWRKNLCLCSFLIRKAPGIPKSGSTLNLTLYLVILVPLCSLLFPCLRYAFSLSFPFPVSWMKYKRLSAAVWCYVSNWQ